MTHRIGLHRSKLRYAATAQAEYENKGWRGSLGLKSTTLSASGQEDAEEKARSFYLREWDLEKKPGDKLVRIYTSVVEI